MKRHPVFQCVLAAGVLLCADLPLLFAALHLGAGVQIALYAAALIFFFLVLLFADGSRGAAKRATTLLRGNALLHIFLLTLTAQLASAAALALLWAGGALPSGLGSALLAWGILAAASELALFWAGMLRLYGASVQLGVKWRVLGLALGWVPVANLMMLRRILRVTANEADFESEKALLDAQRAESQICRTRYPIVLVHGVFFRDFRYFNYWGRIPRALKANGAVLYYGGQQSAETVAACGEELAQKIRAIVRETGCEKVNLIAHSKGGLDSRWAISQANAAPYVASLTTINTPHAGCIFADELLRKIPRGAQEKLARTYNAALRRLGDAAPDFLAAVGDLTHSRCTALDAQMPDADGVFYQSVMSSVAHATGGKFPLNVAYPLVRHYDGENDGLVSVESGLRWAEQTRLTPPKKRGISHADMIDLNRENINGFDVREFYVQLVRDLVARGL